jgi:hypothetical protein
VRHIHPDLRDEEIRAFRISRVRHVFTIPTVGYREIVPPTHTSAPGLSLVNGAQIIGGTLNVNETLALAERAFTRIAEEEGAYA